MLFTDWYSGYIFNIYLKGQLSKEIIEAFDYFLGILENQYQISLRSSNMIMSLSRPTASITISNTSVIYILSPQHYMYKPRMAVLSAQGV